MSRNTIETRPDWNPTIFGKVGVREWKVVQLEFGYRQKQVEALVEIPGEHHRLPESQSCHGARRPGNERGERRHGPTGRSARFVAYQEIEDFQGRGSEVAEDLANIVIQRL